LKHDSILEIVGHGAWNGGMLVDNSIYEEMDMFFKGDIPVTNATIEERIGIRTRIAAPKDTRIAQLALSDLLSTVPLDPSRVKLVIAATNVGEDKYDPGPLVRHPFEQLRRLCPKAAAFDLYAGCPGFNVAVELAFMLSLNGTLQQGDLSIILGAENIHRAAAFRPLDTANIIFGDDALATALETKASLYPQGRYEAGRKIRARLAGPVLQPQIAQLLFELNGSEPLDGIIIDNQLGKLENRVPATAARVQKLFVDLVHPAAAGSGTFERFKDALQFYDTHVNSFAFDIMSLDPDAGLVDDIARAYVMSGRYRSVAAVCLKSDLTCSICLHTGHGYELTRPTHGVVDTATRTHGCFGEFIAAVPEDNDVFGQMNGKGVFLYATRGASTHLNSLLARNRLALMDIDLLIEHQANFAMIPMTIEQLIGQDKRTDSHQTVASFVANKMITNIHTRGNCSVVCMQRLPYDLARGALKADTIQGYPINRNLKRLKEAKLILSDSVGAGMTRSSFLQRLAD
jgi:3-oxoacyl-[acyl-carrier-protein] synthase III